MGVSGLDFVEEYIFLDAVDSANSYAKSLGRVPGGGLIIVRAGRQSGGRGRGGNRFFSDHRGGLWVSAVTGAGDISAHFKHNRAISLAIYDSIKNEAGGADVSIKWPNDIYWGDRKIAGILLENVPENPGVIVIGFGVNVNIPADDFPAELRGSATSVLAETGRELSAEPLLEDILRGYMRYRDDGGAHQLYLGRLYKRGGRATIDRRAGTFVGVEPDGRICIDADDGGRTLFSSGVLRFPGGGL
jgi:BirA family biotin operon repressor/biotin-[acetyl-CoA-carboxylase] ligase